MIASETRTYEARMKSLADALAFVEDYCARAGVLRADALRLAFIVEELFTNTVSHGYGGDCHSPVQVGLERRADTVLLQYADAAAAHNPLESLRGEPGGLATTLSMRPVGGLGVYLIGRLIETARYVRDGDMNRLDLALPLGD
ncbi:MAG: ATP-binding protein [Burkholderiales bacterium]|nr:ATP-binding protein [Burkholderiales bacterium]